MKNVFVIAARINLGFKWKFTKLSKWQTSGILEHSKEFRLLFHFEDVLVKNLLVEKTTVIVTELDKNVLKNASV